MNAIMRIAIFALFLLAIVTTGFLIGEYVSKSYIRDMEASHEHFHEILNFKPEQLGKLIPIEKKFAEQKALYEDQIHLANRELGEIMRQEKAYTPKVQAAVEKVHVAMGRLQEATLIHFFDMRELLNEQQARILDDYVADAMHGL